MGPAKRKASKIGEKTRHQPPRNKRPRTYQAAESTQEETVCEPGGSVSDPIRVTDTETMVESISGDENSECSECSDCGETVYSDKDCSGDEVSEYMESSSDQSYLYQGPELEVEYEENPWKRPSPALPGHVLLRFLKVTQQYGGLYEGTLKNFHDNGCPPDLINESFLQWLWMLMGDSQWRFIDTMRVSRACSAELEDKIEETLRDIQKKQFPKAFNIRHADVDVQKTLASYIKRLCRRQEEAEHARRYFYAMQRVLKSDGVESNYQHPANSVEQKEAMSVSVERDELPAVPERRGPVRRVRRA